MLRTAVNGFFFFFFLTCHALKTWIELSRVKLYRNDLKANKKFLDLAGDSIYRGYESDHG